MKYRNAGVFLCLIAAAAPSYATTQWHAKAGAQSADMGRQAMAFLPNEMWIHAGDKITWTFNANEIQTVTFLVAGEVRTPFQVGCPPGPPPGVTPTDRAWTARIASTPAPRLPGSATPCSFRRPATSSWFAWYMRTWPGWCMYSPPGSHCRIRKGFTTAKPSNFSATAGRPRAAVRRPGQRTNVRQPGAARLLPGLGASRRCGPGRDRGGGRRPRKSGRYALQQPCHACPRRPDGRMEQ